MSAEMGICSKCGQNKRLTSDGLIYLHNDPTITFAEMKPCKGSRRPERRALEDRKFATIIESQKPEVAEVESLWDAVKVLWPVLHGEEGYLVKGMILVECVDTDGRPNFMWVASPYLSDWDIKGFIAQVKDDLHTDSTVKSVFEAIIDAQQEISSEEDEEDEQ